MKQLEGGVSWGDPFAVRGGGGRDARHAPICSASQGSTVEDATEGRSRRLRRGLRDSREGSSFVMYGGLRGT